MSTVDKAAADIVIKNNGIYPGDRIVITHIIVYENIFNGALAYKLCYGQENYEYVKANLACRQQNLFWHRPL